MPDTAVPVDPNLRRLRDEFLSMPGLCLDARQTARLLWVSEMQARALLDTLVGERLIHTVSGRYRRVPRLTSSSSPPSGGVR